MRTPPLYSIKMKLTKTFFLAITASLLLTACMGCKDEKASKSSSEIERAPSLNFTPDDSSQVRALANEYLMIIGNKNYDEAVNMLYKYENDSVRELNAEERKSYLNTMRQLPNYGCKLKGLALYTTNNNRLIYMMQVVSSGSLEDEKGVMKFYLNPVVKDGRWYLTLLDMTQDGTRNIFNL